jgi:hypothetical protein
MESTAAQFITKLNDFRSSGEQHDNRRRDEDGDGELDKSQRDRYLAVGKVRAGTGRQAS